MIKLRFLAVASAAASVFLLSTTSAQAAPVLFAVQAASQVAEDLPYGPGAVTPAAAGVFTGVGSLMHNRWTQQAFDNSGSLFNITWDFATTKSVAQRFDDAVAVGEAVTWTVTSPLIVGSQISTGTWRWSNEANDYGDSYANRFTTSGVNFFSDDDGVFGAGNGVIDGGSPGNTAPVIWGFGNFNNSDASALLRVNGVSQTYDGTFRNLMFVEDGTGAPELNVSSAALPLGMACVTLLMLGDARRRSSLSAV